MYKTSHPGQALHGKNAAREMLFYRIAMAPEPLHKSDSYKYHIAIAPELPDQSYSFKHPDRLSIIKSTYIRMKFEV